MKSVRAALGAQSASIEQAKKSIESNAAAVSKALAAVPAYDLLSAGISTAVKTQASILPVVNGKFAYTSDTSHITWYWDGTNGSQVLTIFWPDGSLTQVPPSSLAISGLSASTTYTFYPYFNVDMNSLLFAQVAGGVGSPAAAYTGSTLAASVAQSLDRNTPLVSAPLTAATTSSGSGGGSGGGNGGACVAEFILVEPLSLSPSLQCCYAPAGEWIDARTAHRRLVAVPNHMVYSDERKLPMKELAPGMEVITKDGLERITEVRFMAFQGRKKIVSCPEGNLYWANGMLSHNSKTL